MYYDDFYSVKLFRLAGGACADCWQQVGSGVPSRRKASIKRLFYYIKTASPNHHQTVAFDNRCFFAYCARLVGFLAYHC